MPKKADRINLTQRFVDTVKPPPKDSVSYPDTQTRGLILRVRSAGSKTWVVRYRWESREHMVTQPAEAVSLASARIWAHSVRTDVARGKPPHLNEVSDTHKNPKTFEELAEEVMQYLTAQGRSEKYVAESRRYLEKVINPKIGTIEAAKLTRLDVDRILRNYASKPATHNRIRALLTKTLNQGRKWQVLYFDWYRDLDKQTERPRESYLRNDQFDRLLASLENTTTDNCVRFLLLTGARPGEAFKAKWGQFDLAEGVWRKPAENVKNRTAHTVPLAQESIELLTNMRAKPDANEEWVFPSPRPGKTPHLTTIKKRWASLVKLAGLDEGARLYDVRKTFATRLLSQGASVKTVASLTGHKDAATLLKHYTQIVNDDQRKALEGLTGKPKAKAKVAEPAPKEGKRRFRVAVPVVAGV